MCLRSFTSGRMGTGQSLKSGMSMTNRFGSVFSCNLDINRHPSLYYIMKKSAPLAVRVHKEEIGNNHDKSTQHGDYKNNQPVKPGQKIPLTHVFHSSSHEEDTLNF